MDKRQIAIVTDSTADLKEEWIALYHIHVVPLDVIFGEQVFQDRVTLAPEDFYRKLDETDLLPTTSQPSTARFVEVFSALCAQNYVVIGIFISAKLSGTYQGALTAATMVQGDITVFDSTTTTAALGMQVIEAAKMAEAGEDKNTILRKLDAMVTHMDAYIVLDTLEHLHRGGRIGGAAKFVGTLLQVKPILYLKDGSVDVFAKVRTTRKALDFLVDQVAKACEGKANIEIFVIYSLGADVEGYVATVSSRIPHATVHTTMIGPVVGNYAGSRSLGLVVHVED